MFLQRLLPLPAIAAALVAGTLFTGCIPRMANLPAPPMPFDPAQTQVADVPEPGSDVVYLEPGDDIQFRAQAAVLAARPGTTIVFPAGRHVFDDEFVINTSHITIAGHGMNNTILDFGQQQSGAQGVLSYGDHFTMQDIAVVDPAGDGVRAEGVDGVTFRRVRVEWSTSSGDNGGYGLYPVMSDNVLIEDSVVKGASDAGIYVGQSENIIVRRNVVERNVAGIEIENSKYADVHDNWTAYNTAGILIFDLPNLVRQGGRNTRVFGNVLYRNDSKNFAHAGNILAQVPSGTGILITANDQVEVFNNRVSNHGTVSVLVVDFRVLGLPLSDPNYDPTPEGIHIHNNLLERNPGQYKDGSDMNTLLILLHGRNDPSLIQYDGIGEPLAGDDRLCIQNNTALEVSAITFSNLNLENNSGTPLPKGPVSYDSAPHNCAHAPLSEVVLPPAPPPPNGDDGYSDEEIAQICGAGAGGVNWGAFVVDCPNLASYNLFVDPENALSAPLGNGVPYDLTTPLFSDYAHKARTVYVPPGAHIQYGVPDFIYPVGTIISKTFYYRADDRDINSSKTIVETRLLIHRASGWARLPYIWNNGVATLAVGGGERHVSWIDTAGQQRSTDYQVPNINQCSSCHGPRQTDKPLGPVARRLHMNYNYGAATENQLTHWANAGILANLPSDLNSIARHPVWNDPGDGTLDQRARAYLDANCAHCHAPGRRAASTGLWLNYDQPVNANLGLCKTPISAGSATGDLQFDVVPGHAEQSIMIYRMNSAAANIKMPELSKTLVHDEGVALVSAWINTLTGNCSVQ